MPLPSFREYQDPEVIQRLLHNSKTIAVVGLSNNVLRASNFVGFYLKRHGFRVVPVNPRESTILNEPSYPSLRDVPFPIDIVNVFRLPDAVPEIARDAIAVRARALWMQFGVISQEGAEMASAAGLDVVMDRCVKYEHARYIGRMHWFGFNTGQVSSQRRHDA